MGEIEIYKNNKYAEPGNCFYYQKNEDKLFYLKFTGNVAFFAIISGVNLQKEDHLITIMNDIASGSLDLVDNMHLSDFLITDDINAQQINKKTGSRYNYTENYVWEFF